DDDDDDDDDDDNDSDNDGIPDDQDNDNSDGGTGGDSDGSFGGKNSRIDLNGSGSGYNYTGPWNKNGLSELATGDSTIKGDDTVKKLTISIVGGGQNAGQETLTASVAGRIASSYANGVLTLTGPATRQAFETVLRSVRYANPPATVIVE